MTLSQPISILIVDDELRFRQGLQNLLGFYNAAGTFTFEVVGEADSSTQAIKLAAELKPALILLDMELSQGDGIATLMRLAELHYSSRVLVLSAHREDEWIFRAMQSGACGYVFKDLLATHLYDAISTVMNHQIYLPPEVATCFFRLFHSQAGSALQACQALQLTEREREVLQLLIQGTSNEEIARQLYITVGTVKAHLTAIFEKLEVSSRTQAIVKALKLGLVYS